MNLKEFVSAVISEIVHGIHDANEDVAKLDAIVNPVNVKPVSASSMGSLYGHVDVMNVGRAVQKVGFDVAITAEEGKSKKSGIGVTVATLGLGMTENSRNLESLTSRVRFTIPVAFPEHRATNS